MSDMSDTSENKYRVCSFTGHRNVPVSGELKLRLAQAVEKLITEGVTEFYSGGAIGWDLLCARAVIYLRRSYPGIRLHMLLPCPPEKQTAKWTKQQKALYHSVLDEADSIAQTSEHYYNGCMALRNKKLIEAADVCLCYCSKRSSGTGQTVNMAMNKGIRIINLYDERYETDNPD